MRYSEYYRMRLPERGALEGQPNDPADVEDLTYNFEVIDAELDRQKREGTRLEQEKATRQELARHANRQDNPHGVTAAQVGAYTRAEADEKAAGAVAQHAGKTDNPHGVTKAQVGLGAVPNVATNDQAPTYTAASAPAALASGEKLSTALGKLAAAVTALIGHLADSVKHITAAERTAWNSKAAGNHTHAAATQSAAGLLSAADKKKLDGVTAGANAYSLPAASDIVRGGVKTGYAANGKKYPVKLDAEKMYVEVPWTDTNTTYTAAAATPKPAAGAGAVGTSAKYAREDHVHPMQDAENSAKLSGMDLDQILRAFLLSAHPVGSYYWSSSATNPATLFGGTWTQIQNRFVFAAGTGHAAGTTGGAETVTLTAAQIPNHTHDINIKTEIPTDGYDGNGGPGGQVTYHTKVLGASYGTVSTNCGGGAHDNMPPYICAYCWRRTA